MDGQHKIEILKQEVSYRFGCLRNLISTVEDWAEASEQDERQALLEWGRAQGYDVDNMTISELKQERVTLAISDPPRYGEVSEYRSVPSWSDENTRTAHSAILLMIIATFEDLQQRVLTFFREISDEDLKPNELRGNSAERFKRYAKKVLKIKYDFGESDIWEKMRDHNRIRNFIAHEGGINKSKKENNDTKRIVDKYKKISFDEGGRLKIEEEYLRKVLSDSENFIERSIEELEKAFSA